jgi:hypothetical protein
MKHKQINDKKAFRLKIELTDDFNENVETIAEIIFLALDECSGIPELSVDGFCMKLHFTLRKWYGIE